MTYIGANSYAAAFGGGGALSPPKKGKVSLLYLFSLCLRCFQWLHKYLASPYILRKEYHTLVEEHRALEKEHQALVEEHRALEEDTSDTARSTLFNTASAK